MATRLRRCCQPMPWTSLLAMYSLRRSIGIGSQLVRYLVKIRGVHMYEYILMTTNTTRTSNTESCPFIHNTECHSYDGPLLEEEALVKAAEAGLASAKYVNLCRWLVLQLKPLCNLEEVISSSPGKQEKAILSPFTRAAFGHKTNV